VSTSGCGPIATPHAPAAIGAYSQAIHVGGFVFCSGQIGLDPATGELVPGGLEAETQQVLRNLAAVLRAADADFGDLVRTTIFLADIADFATVNRIYGEMIGGARPARSTVAVAALPRGARVEIDAIALPGARLYSGGPDR
jgi:2-iminobutanoate/2-iminopropanoate deaminase